MDDNPKAVLTQISTPPTVTDQPLSPPTYIARPALTRAPIVYSRDFAYANNEPIIILPARMAATDITNASAKTFAELLSGPVVDIYVGSQRRKWTLHQNLLQHHSSYCEQKFQPQEQEKTETSRLELPQDDPVGFELLVKWLYQGTIQSSSDFESDTAKYEHAVACHKLWMLCDRFDMIKLKNLAMDTYRRCLNESQLVPDADEINEIYGSSPSRSPFKSLMIKIAARQIMDPEIERSAEAYRKCLENNPDFAIEVIGEIRKMSKGILFDDPTKGDACPYHDHADISGCPMQGKGKMRMPKKRTNTEAQGPSADLPATPLHQHVELKRTPRKLRTPFKTPSAPPMATPKSLPPKLNGSGSRVMAHIVSNRAVSDDGAPLAFADVPSDDSQLVAPEILQLRVPTRNATEWAIKLQSEPQKTPNVAFETVQRRVPIRNATEWSSSLRGEIESRGTTETQAGPETPAPTTVDHVAVEPEIVVASDASVLAEDQRTPRKHSMLHNSASNNVNGDGSIISGPRKLRVSSIVRKINDENSNEAKVVRRQPAKLARRVGSLTRSTVSIS